jgi:hypothetical protein
MSQPAAPANLNLRVFTQSGPGTDIHLIVIGDLPWENVLRLLPGALARQLVTCKMI